MSCSDDDMTLAELKEMQMKKNNANKTTVTKSSNISSHTFDASNDSSDSDDNLTLADLKKKIQKERGQAQCLAKSMGKR